MRLAFRAPKNLTPARRALLLGLALAVPAALSGCGWAPLYADPVSAPADADLRAIRVEPIPERVGQKLELGLRQSLNPSGAPTPQRYVLRTVLQVSQVNLGILTQGLGTRGRIDLYAHFYLNDIKSGALLVSGLSHVADSFDLLANGYANVVARQDAERRVVAELRRDLVARLTVFMQQRAAKAAAKPPVKS